MSGWMNLDKHEWSCVFGRPGKTVSVDIAIWNLAAINWATDCMTVFLYKVDTGWVGGQKYWFSSGIIYERNQNI